MSIPNSQRVAELSIVPDPKFLDEAGIQQLELTANEWQQVLDLEKLGQKRASVIAFALAHVRGLIPLLDTADHAIEGAQSFARTLIDKLQEDMQTIRREIGELVGDDKDTVETDLPLEITEVPTDVEVALGRAADTDPTTPQDAAQRTPPVEEVPGKPAPSLPKTKTKTS